MTPKEFRAKLVKIMPGYSWTVHNSSSEVSLRATGIQSSGFNRLSTLVVEYRDDSGGPWYVAKSAGYGARAPFLASNGDATLARALRGLQQHYETKAAIYSGHARALENARKMEQPA